MLLYKTLIVPIYDYCDHIYYPLSANSADTLQKLQNIALGTIVRAEPRTSTDRLHTQAQMPRLDLRRKLHVADQMYGIINGNHPQECKSMFTHLNTIRVRNTRSEAENLLVVPKRRLVTTERCIKYFGTIIWNSIPEQIRQSPTKALFQESLKAYWSSKCGICITSHVTLLYHLLFSVWDNLVLYICTYSAVASFPNNMHAFHIFVAPSRSYRVNYYVCLRQ